MSIEPLNDDEIVDYRQALENASELARQTNDFLGQQDDPRLMLGDVQIVLGNPTVKEYKVTIVPGP